MQSDISICISISMSGVAAQGNPCTVTIFWCIVRPHRLYSASSSVLLTKYSILHKNLTIAAWFHTKVYLSDEIWIQLKPSQFIFSCRFLVVHISPTITWELNSHHQQSPMRVEGIQTTRGASKRLFATLISTPHDVSHRSFGGPEPCSPS
jgi:hypothetical protein